MKRALLILTPIIAIALYAAWYMYNKPVADVANLKATLFLSAEALYEQFEADEDEANALLTGQTIEVRGTVAQILENSDGSNSAVLASKHPIYGVKCRLTPGSEIPEVGAKVKLKCICTGMNGDVEMNPCTPVKTPTP